MANILVVTKDNAEFQIYQPLTALLRTLGHKVTIVAEGLSLDKWLALNEPVVGGKGEPSAFDQHLCRSDIDVGQILEHLMPDLVFTGLPDPNNLGEKFGLAANQMGFKLGYVIDVWGAESRSRAVPDFICTLDALGKKKIEAWSPYQSRMPHIHVTGSPAMDALASVKDPAFSDLPLVEVLEKHNRVVLLAGQDESTTPVVEGLVSALDADGANYILVPRFHPKLMHRTDLVTAWCGALAKAKGEVLWVGGRVSTRSLMRIATYTVSIYSNALIEAAALGSLPVSWTSDVGRAKMREALGGLERFPLVDLGCCIEVSSPEGFREGVPHFNDDDYSDLTSVCQKAYKADGKNTERVVAAIESELH